MSSPKDYIEARVYEATPGDRIRIAIPYGGDWPFIFWIKVGNDGSTYLGPRYNEILGMKTGAKRTEEGRLTITYEEGTEVTDPHHLNMKGKVSFHASGVINAAGFRLIRAPLRNISEQQELCRVLFQHPTRFASDSVGDRDVLLDYPYDEERPIQAIVFVAPLHKGKLVRIRDCTFQVNLIFPFKGLDGVPDLSLQVVMFHGSKVEWPPCSSVIFGPLETALDYGTSANGQTQS